MRSSENSRFSQVNEFLVNIFKKEIKKNVVDILGKKNVTGMQRMCWKMWAELLVKVLK